VRPLWVGVLLASMVLLLAGCSSFVDQDQVRVAPAASVTLEPDHPVGQTFVAHHAGLNGVEVWLEPGQAGPGEIRLHLRSDRQPNEDVATAVLTSTAWSPVETPAAGFYRFSFPPQHDSHGRYYYAFLELTGGKQVGVGAGPGDAYLDGALYRDHRPRDAQAAFRLAYDPFWILVDLGQAGVGWLGLLGVAGLLYVVPGWALLVWLWPGSQLSWAARLGIAVGVSLALYPLLLLWTDLAGLHLGPLYAWLPIVVGLAAIAWRYRAWRPRQGWETLRQWARSEVVWPDLALLAVLGLVFGVRLLVVRSLDAPLWGDSYHHTMMVRLLVDHGGLFDSWEPYATLQTFTYHFGFHTEVAAFHWLTGSEFPSAVLWFGQILNGLAVLALYPLAVRASGSRWAGVVAVLVAGLLSPMPMYYVNWGRYTQLAGQAILPAAVLITWMALEAPGRKWRLAILGWIVVGGLALTHYRVLIFYVVFVLAWVLLSLRRATWRRALSRVTWVGLGGAVLFWPWLFHISAGGIARNFGYQVSTPPDQLHPFAVQYNALGDLSFYLPSPLWLLLLVAVMVGLWQRRHGVLLAALWWFLLLVATNPAWLQLPGTGAISNHALFMAAYIPGGVLIGDLCGQLVAWLEPRRAGFQRLFGAAAVLLVVGVGLGGLRSRMGDLQVFQHALLTRPDLRAMTWIRENTPGGAVFLINSFFAYGGSAVVGSDGGWWLPLLAGRANTVPPLNYGTEQGPRPAYREWVNELTRQLQGGKVDDPATLAMLREHQVTHVYIGQRQGRVNYEGPDVLDPAALLRSEHYRLAYHLDRVWVFELAGRP